VHDFVIPELGKVVPYGVYVSIREHLESYESPVIC
jgi:hypothetical protein